MEGDANTKTLRQLTKRERKSGKRNDAIKAAAKGEQEVEKSTIKMSLPGAEYLKKLTTTTAINVMAFGVACLAIYKYGD